MEEQEKRAQIGEGQRGDPDREDEALFRIACSIKAMPDLDPPADLLPSVMSVVRLKRRPWWYRAYRWARTPRSISVTPLQAAPAFAVLLAVCVLSFFYLLKGGVHNSFEVPSQDRIPVVLSLKIPDARSVAVIGSFNDWHPHDCEMHKNNGEQTWTATLWLPAGRFEYTFLVDGGKIVPDPHAGLYQDDGFGNLNTVLVVGNRDENAI